MSEIERAIDDFNNYVEMGYGQYFRPSSESTEIALTALKEKLEREKNPLTWSEHINQMTVEEKAVFFSELFNCATCPIIEECQHDCNTMLTKWLNSPYTEGATK